MRSPPTLPSVDRTAGRQIDTPAKKCLQAGMSTDAAVEAITVSAVPVAIMAMGMQASGAGFPASCWEIYNTTS